MRFALTLTLLLVCQEIGFTQLSGILNGTLGPGQFQVTDTISVIADDTLEIEPGTTFLFDGPFTFEITGTLLAEGTAEDSIVFSIDALANPDRWRGMRFYPGSSNSSLSYCRVEYSLAQSEETLYERGGGLYIVAASPSFSNCTISDNESDWLAGGLYCENAAAPVLENCIFIRNHAVYGGGIYGSHASPTFINCVIRNNSALSYGGGGYMNTSPASLIHCTFFNNAAELWSERGGGLFVDESDLDMRGCIVAYSEGAGVFFDASPNAQIANCDFYGCSGEVLNFLNDDSLNGPEAIGQIDTLNANEDPADRYLNIFRNPMFEDTTIDLRLSINSRLLGAADTTEALLTDIEGNPRPNPPGTFPDIGAYEHELGSPYIPDGISGSLSDTLGPGEFLVVDSIVVDEGDTLVILPGTILEFFGPYPFVVFGTLLAEGTLEDSIIFTTDTLLNEDRWRGLRILDPASHRTRLSYCVVEYGSAEGFENDSRHGGGVLCDGSNAVFDHCTFRMNQAQWGAGVACRYNMPSFEKCVLENNSTTTYGGGLYTWYASPILTNCIIQNNTASFGGGASLSQSSPEFNHCTIVGNSASSHGGGIAVFNSDPHVTNSIITNSTGEGIYFAFSQEASIEYCDFFDNSGSDLVYSDDNPEHGPTGLSILVSVNMNEDSCDVNRNIFLDPEFADENSNDYHLQDSSPCAGAAQLGDIDNDFDSLVRPSPSATYPDIGAFENQDMPTLPDGLAESLEGTLGPGNLSVVDTITVQSGDTLSLLPGTTFEFLGAFPFLIYGTLFAEGTESDSIVFTTDTLLNPARWRGIKFFEEESSQSTLAYCLIENGLAVDTGVYGRGGGIHCDYSSPTISNCVFQSGRANKGGGLSLWYASPTVTDCIFRWNGGENFGGAVHAWYSTSIFTNCILSKNQSLYGGGTSLAGGTPEFIHCSLFANEAEADGGGVNLMSSSAVFRSTIIAYSEGNGISLFESPASTIEYCCVYGNSEEDFAYSDTADHAPPDLGILSTTNANSDSCDDYFNILFDPLPEDTAAMNFYLRDISLCIGAASSANPPVQDFDANSRPDPPGSSPDIGAFEHDLAEPLPTDALVGYLDGTIGPGTFHVIGTIHIQLGDSLRILPATTLIFDGPYPFRVNGIMLAEGTEADSIIFTADTLANPDRWRGIRFLGNETSGSRLAYCLIENSHATGVEQEDKRGGAVYCEFSNPNIVHCLIRYNRAEYWGGGIACWYASPGVSYCSIENNLADSFGGGLYCWESSPFVYRDIFYSNIADYGGGASLSGGVPQIIQNTFYDNIATEQGGSLRCGHTEVIVNSTIIAASQGAAIYFVGSPDSEIRYCDLFDNETIDFQYSNNDSVNGPPAIGILDTVNVNEDSTDRYFNLYLDPMFDDAASGDFNLTAGTPCWNTGDPLIDPDPDGSVADIGALPLDLGFRPPFDFVLLSPVWSDTCWTLDTTLTWEAAIDTNTNDTVSYEIYLDTLADLSTAWIAAENHLTETLALTNLFDDHSFYWTVHASDLNTAGTWASDTLMFRTYFPEAPLEFDFASPADEDTIFTETPTLSWYKAFDPDPGDTVCYRLEWSYQSSFNDFEEATTCDTFYTFPEDVLFASAKARPSFIVTERKASEKNSSKQKRSGQREITSPLDEVEQDSTVYWKVEAFDRFSITTPAAGGTNRSFYVYVEESPNEFSLLTPANNDTLHETQAVLSWQGASDPDPGDSIAFYRVYLSSDSEFLSPDSQQTIETTLTWENLLDDSSFWWKVKAFDTHGNHSASSETWSFHVYIQEPPNSFTQLSPTHNAILDTLAAELVWEAAIDPDPGDSIAYYRIYLAGDSLLTDADSQQVATEQYIWEELPDDSSLWWRVRAFDTQENDRWSVQSFRFSTSYPEPPTDFTLIEPLDQDTVHTLTPTLRWTASSDPDPQDSVCYRLTWSYNQEFIEFEDSVLSDTFFTFSEDVLFSGTNRKNNNRMQRGYTLINLDEVAEDSTVYWKVAAFDISGLETSADPEAGWKFTVYIEEPPAGFDLIEPVDTDTLDSLSVFFSWEAAADPDPGDSIEFYQVLLANDSLFTLNPDSQTSQSVNLFWDNLEDDEIYWWKVKAFDTHGSVSLSNQTWHFRTYVCEPPAAFDLLEPADSSYLPFGDINFCWQSSHDPDPADSVIYAVHFLSMDTSFSVEMLTDTCLVYDLGSLGFENTIFEWWTEVHSFCPDTVFESISHYHVYPPNTTDDAFAGLPTEYALYQNYPNPFNPSTTISFDVKQAAFVSIKIYDLVGQEVATLVSRTIPSGRYTVEWNAAGLTSGLYFCRMQTSEFTEVRKLLLVR